MATFMMINLKNIQFLTAILPVAAEPQKVNQKLYANIFLQDAGDIEDVDKKAYDLLQKVKGKVIKIKTHK